MSKLTPFSPLLKARSHTVPHLKHYVFVYMMFRELQGGWTSVTTREISDLLPFNLNKANQILRRMRDYGFIKGHKQVTTIYELQDLSCADYRKTITVKGWKLPDPYTYSDVIAKETRNSIQWSLTGSGRDYAKRIWYEPDRYNLPNWVSYFELLLQLTEFNNRDEMMKYYTFLNGKKSYLAEKEKTENLKGQMLDSIEEMTIELDQLKAIKEVKNYYISKGFSIGFKKDNPGYDVMVKKDDIWYEVKINPIQPNEKNITFPLSDLLYLKNTGRHLKYCFLKQNERGDKSIFEVDIH